MKFGYDQTRKIKLVNQCYKHLTNLVNFRRFFARKIVDFHRSHAFLPVIAIVFIKSAVIFKRFLGLS